MKNSFLFALPFLIMTSCSNKKLTQEITAAPEAENVVVLTPLQIKNAGIVAGSLQNREVTSVLKVNGQIDVPPQNRVSVSVPLGGYLKSTKLLEGMFVSKGEVIAIIEDPQYIQLQQDYLTAKAKATYLQHEYERQKELNQSKATSDKAYDLSESEFKTQLVLIKALSEKLKLANINVQKLNEESISRTVPVYSPISGYVSKVNVNIGKYMSPTDVLFEIVNPNDIHLALKVFEKDLSKLSIGQRLYAYTNNDPQKKYVGEVSLIGKDLTAERNTDVHCHFKHPDPNLVPGTYMNAEIAVINKNARVLPDEAVVRFSDKEYVFMETDKNQFEMIAVTTGDKDGGFTEIQLPENLQNKQYVTKGAYSLLMTLKNNADE